MGSDLDDQADRDRSLHRRELERIAFGKPVGEADTQAARDALRQLADDDDHAATTIDTTGHPALVPDAQPTPPDDAADDTAAAPPASRRRRLRPLLAALAFVVVFAIGFGLGRGLPWASLATSQPNPGASGFARFAPSTTFHLNPGASSAAAEAALSQPQTPDDVSVTPELTGLGIEKRSLHRILQVRGGLTLWIGRTTKDICLIFTRDTSQPDNSIGAGADCATPKEFDDNGLALGQDGYTWTWDGTNFGTTSTGPTDVG